MDLKIKSSSFINKPKTTQLLIWSTFVKKHYKFHVKNPFSNRFLSKSVRKWIFDMEFVVFFHESSPNQELGRFWLINEIFNFLFLNKCLVTKMSWEIDFYQNRFAYGFLTWNL